MSETPKSLPANPSLVQLQKQAKDRLRARRSAGRADSTLAGAQFELAREYGFPNWAELKHHIDALRPSGIEAFEKLADDLAAAFTSADESAVRAINANLRTAFPTDFHDSEKVRQQMPTWYASEARAPELAVADARQMLAHAYGVAGWPAFAASLRQPAADPRSAPVFLNSRPPFYSIDWTENRLSARGPQSPKDWEEILRVVEEHGIAKLAAGGITDDAMAALAHLECVTHLNVSGSKGLTDSGAQSLARMPQLVDLEMGGWHTELTDRAFEPLRHLSALRQFKACWTSGLSDAGAAHLGACPNIESINVMGSRAGDGLIRALAGKTTVRFLDTGCGVTDAGIPALRDIPAFSSWQGGEVEPGLMGAAKLPNRLMIDGGFTDAGLASLVGLDGVAALSFFWHSKSFTPEGLAHLRLLPMLQVFGIDGPQCGDEAMRQIAAFPRLRQLQAQGAVAGDAGWQALGRAQNLEYIWGRDCPNFSSAAFRSLAALPALRGIGIGCQKVDDAALSELPRFPALRQLVSIGFTDAAFRHIGQCERLEALYCMYCRDTGDASTAHIRTLPKLKTYYAGMTQITDRSLELLAQIPSIETLEFWQCMSLTGAGVAHLARLPNLRRVEISGSPHVSKQSQTMFPASVTAVWRG